MSIPDVPNFRGAVDLSGLTQRSASASSGVGEPAAHVPPGTQVPVPSLVLTGTDQNFTAILDLSQQVPVIVSLWSEQVPQCAQLATILNKLIQETFQGRLVLVEIDVNASPQLAQAFQAQSVPMAAAVLAGRPLPLFEGVPSESDITSVLEQVLEVAAQNNVVGIAKPQQASADAESTAVAQPEEPPIPPAYKEAYDAAEAGDYDKAIVAWENVLKNQPSDSVAQAGLAQMKLLKRLQGKTMAEVRDKAAAHPLDIEAQCDVADLDLSGGHIEDAFDRLLVLYPQVDQDGKDVLRQRLLELFEVVGVSDPLVNAARARLTNLMY